MNASVVLMSGFGAPFLTATPATERARSVRDAGELALLDEIVDRRAENCKIDTAPFSISPLSWRPPGR